MKKIIYILFFATLYLLLCMYASSYAILFSGTVEGNKILAISVNSILDETALDNLTKSLINSYSIIIVYKNYKEYSSLEPLAVYINKERKQYNPEFKYSSSFPTIQNNINSATGRVRIGAICRDGTRSNATGKGACSHHKGVARWLYEEIKDESAVVAYICRNYFLESQNNFNCSKNEGILVIIKNRNYS